MPTSLSPESAAPSVETANDVLSESGNADALLQYLSGYLPPEDVALVERAYRFADRAHAGVTRKSGGDYIEHPIAVAQILAGMHLDADTLCAAILHDVIEDTSIPKEELAEEFSPAIAELVDGVTKLDALEDKALQQAESFRKMMMAMTEDLRVILIKLADRLHNMRTLYPFGRAKQERIARETLEIYAPIAARLGINSMRTELEDLAFEYRYPERYRVLEKRVRQQRGNRRDVVERVIMEVETYIAEAGIQAEINGREKHLYGIYTKMRKRMREHRHGKSGDVERPTMLRQVRDIYGIRVLTSNVDDCYRVLGVVHAHYRPVEGRFKDFIAIPKANGYQSLHTGVRGPGGIPIEIQIRTEAMHQVAQAGVAAHWLYKSDDDSVSSSQARANEWFRRVLDIRHEAGDSVEFLESMKVDLFPDEVYVFTPKGAILRLPKGATPVDFAYAVHTDVGNHCLGARIGGRRVLLSSPLESGQTVEIITDPNAWPQTSWLNSVVTGKARAAVRNYVKGLERDDAERMGRKLLDKALVPYSISITQVDAERIRPLLEEFELESTRDLYAAIGLGERLAPLVARRLADLWGKRKSKRERLRQFLSRRKTDRLLISGTEGLAVSLGKCCGPIPGDSIVGFLSAGRGMVVHRTSCKNARAVDQHPEKWVDLEWEAGDDHEPRFATQLFVQVRNRRGVLAQVAGAIADAESNIENVVIADRDEAETSLRFDISVSDRVHLANVVKQLRRMKDVNRVARGAEIRSKDA